MKLRWTGATRQNVARLASALRVATLGKTSESATDAESEAITIIGFDPGPTETGVAVIRSVRGRAQFLAAMNVQSTAREFIDLEKQYCPDVVAIESVVGYAYEQQRSAGLIATSRIAGLLNGLFGHLHITEMPAKSWRKVICGRGNADDDDVKNCLPIWVSDMPVRTNVHMRDALGVAAVAALQFRKGVTRVEK